MCDELRDKNFVIFLRVLLVQNTVARLLEPKAAKAVAATVTVVTVEKMIALVGKITESTHLQIDDITAVVEKFSVTGAHQIHTVRIAMAFVGIEAILKVLRVVAVVDVFGVKQVVSRTLLRPDLPEMRYGNGQTQCFNLILEF